MLTSEIKHVHLLVHIWEQLQTPTTTLDTAVQPLGWHIANQHGLLIGAKSSICNCVVKLIIVVMKQRPTVGSSGRKNRSLSVFKPHATAYVLARWLNWSKMRFGGDGRLTWNCVSRNLVLRGVHMGITWQIRLNCLCFEALQTVATITLATCYRAVCLFYWFSGCFVKILVHCLLGSKLDFRCAQWRRQALETIAETRCVTWPLLPEALYVHRSLDFKLIVYFTRISTVLAVSCWLADWKGIRPVKT